MQGVEFLDFGIILGNRRTGNDHFGKRHVFGAMPFKNRRAQTGQSLGHRGTLQVRTGNLVTEIEQHFGNAAHADAADAYEMDALNFGKHILANTLANTKVNFWAADLRRFAWR